MARYRPPKGVIPAQLAPFKPGHTVHPTTVALTSVKEARRLAKQKSAEAMRRLIELMDSDDHRVAYMAVTAVLDRGLGKPTEGTADTNEEPQAKLDVTKLSPEQREQLRAILQQGTVTSEPQKVGQDLPTAENDPIGRFTSTPVADSSRAPPRGLLAPPQVNDVEPDNATV